jgi:hypothetical protein
MKGTVMDTITTEGIAFAVAERESKKKKCFEQIAKGKTKFGEKAEWTMFEFMWEADLHKDEFAEDLFIKIAELIEKVNAERE